MATLRESLIEAIGHDSLPYRLRVSSMVLLFILLTGLADYYVSAVNLFILYTLAVVFASLFLGWSQGILMSILASLMNFFTNQKYLDNSGLALLMVNLSIDLVLFLLVAFMVAQLKAALLREQAAARRDYLTGLGNRRFFMERIKERNSLFENEYSLCYMDIDHYNDIIEREGLGRGDELVKVAARFIRQRYPEVYRYDEDRFVIALNEIDGQTALAKMGELKDELQAEFARRNRPLTFSVAIVMVTRKGFQVADILSALFKIVNLLKVEGGDRIKYHFMQ